MYYTIYQITNLVNGKIYIGKHQTKNLDDYYFGSSRFLKDSVKKHGKENFKKTILFTFESADEMNAKEAELVNKDFVSRADTYNICEGGRGGSIKGRKCSPETRLKLKEVRNSLDRKILHCEVGKRVGIASKGQKLSERAKDNISVGSKLRMSNEEERLKISESLKQFYIRNPEHMKTRKTRVRKPLSEETKQKLRDHWNLKRLQEKQ